LVDSKIRARFYQVENVGVGDPTFFDCLTQLAAHPNRGVYQDIFGGARVRMESFERDPNVVGNGFVDGEFVRQQTDNIPPIADQGAPLRGNISPLGHRCAFRYHARLNVLLLETRREAVTPLRMDALVKARLAPHRGFFLSPVLSEAALENLRNGTPRRVTFRVARPADMDLVEDEEIGIEENLARLQNHFGGPNIEVTASWPRGDRNGILNAAAIGRAIRWASGNRDHVEKFQVKISEEPEAIDIFAEQLKGSEVLDLDNQNVGLNFATRRDFLMRTFRQNMPILERLYGGNAVN
jgi:hypothetical protein